MPRLRVAVAAAVLAVAAVTAPDAVAAPDRAYVLAGTTTSYVDVAFYMPMTFHPPVVSTRGRYAGVFVQQLNAPNGPLPAGGWVAIRGLSADATRMDPVVIGEPARVVPGVARIYLIADGPTTVRFEHNGGPQGVVTFRPRERASAQARVVPLRANGATWSATVPLRVARNSPALAAVQVGGRLPILANAEVCLRTKAAPCPWQPENLLFAQPGLLDPLSPEQRWSYSRARGTGPWGDVLASATLKPVDPLTRAVLAGFTLTLAP